MASFLNKQEEFIYDYYLRTSPSIILPISVIQIQQMFWYICQTKNLV